MGRFLQEALGVGAEVAPASTSTLQGPVSEDAVTQAAQALLASPPTDQSFNPLVQAFQTTWNAAGKTPALAVDGIYGPDTASALTAYGTPPPIPAPNPNAPEPASGGGSAQVRVATPVTPQALADALATVWPSVIGGAAPNAGILVLLAQSAFETGDWKACWNWNLGNVKHVAGDGADWFTMTAPEVNNGKTINVSSQFRSYPTLQAGAKAYLAILKRRFSSAWPYVLAGDPTGFVVALKAANYFTGNLDAYKAGVLRYWNQFQGIVPTIQKLEDTIGPAGTAAAGYLGLSTAVYFVGGTVVALLGWLLSHRR